MIRLRTMTVAYLMNKDDFLLMKRSEKKRFKPGIWAGVGGHLEPEEINDPLGGCLREIYEETGIAYSEINDIKLKYIITRRSKDEIRVQYVYFGYSATRNTLKCDEGELYWVNKNELLNRELSVTTIETLKHYLKYGDKIEDLIAGIVNVVDNKPVMNWVPVQDWEC